MRDLIKRIPETREKLCDDGSFLVIGSQLPGWIRDKIKNQPWEKVLPGDGEIPCALQYRISMHYLLTDQLPDSEQILIMAEGISKGHRV